MENPKVTIKKLSDLKMDPRNANKHTQRGRGMVERSQRERGFARPAFAASDGTLIGGNLSVGEVGAEVFGTDSDVIVIETDGKTPIVHIRTDIDSKSKEAKLLALEDNRTAEVSLDWDTDVLEGWAAFDGIDLGDFWNDKELKDIGVDIGDQESVDAEPEIDRAEELREKWGVETGQLWQLGEHRLVCGDCTDAAVVDRVMGGEKADMVFTDPPYGHNNNDGDLIHNREKALGKPQVSSSNARPIANDSPEDAARVYSAFLRISNDLLSPGCCCCCCCCGGGGPDPQFARWSLEMDSVIGFKHAVVWDKGGLGMGWHYRRNYEFILVAEKPGAKCHWFGGNDIPNVIRGIGKIIPSKDQHPTEKPVELPEFFIKLHSQKDEIVFDPFGGSGTTLIACHNLQRRARLIEISPAYCAVILQRFYDSTGIEPVLLENA